MKFRVFCVIFSAVFIVGAFFMTSQAKDLKAKTEIKNAEVAAAKKEAEEKTAEAEAVVAKISELKQQKVDIANKIEEAKVLKAYLTSDVVYLTFDDGPSPKNCEKILDILKENDVKATFFVVGTWLDPENPNYSEKSVKMLKRMADEGHSIGIHAYNHDYPTIYKSVNAFFEDFDKVEKLITDITGQRPSVMRFPSGSITAKGFCKKYSGSADTFPTITAKLKERGYMIVDWNMDSNDWRSGQTAEGIKEVATKYAIDVQKNHPRGAVLSLMHEKNLSVSVLPDVIKIFKKYNYNFMTVQNGGYTVIQAAS